MTTGRINQVATLTANLTPAIAQAEHYMQTQYQQAGRSVSGIFLAAADTVIGAVLASFPRIPTEHSSDSNQRYQSIVIGSIPKEFRKLCAG